MAGPSLKDVIKAAHGLVETAALSDDDEHKRFPDYVLPRHMAWLDRGDDRAWSPAAIAFNTAVITGQFVHARDKRISPSSIGDGCERVLLFGFAGAPKAPFPRPYLEKMDAGNFHHLRWQMEGISAGYMAPPPGLEHAGEIWTHSQSLRCGGSADARLEDGSLFELKTTGGHLFDAIARGQAFLDGALAAAQTTGKGSAAAYAAGMHAKHKLQMETYWLVDEVAAKIEGRERYFTDWGSLVYQDPGDPSKIHEVRLHASPSRRQEVHRILEGLHDWIDIDDLPDMLEGCEKASRGVSVPDKQLQVYARCAYRDFCPTATRVRLE